MGSIWRYAKPEHERRFLVTGVPSDAVDPVKIHDRYIEGTGLRLREVLARDGSRVFKLGHKVRPDPGDPSTVAHTSMYLSPEEVEVLAALPAHELRKTRFFADLDGTPVSFNHFDGPLRGLVLAEVGFPDAEAMAAFQPPERWLSEVTADERYTGGELARTPAEGATELLAPRRRRRSWVRWHDPYDDPSSYLSRRVAVVRHRLSEALHAAPAGPIRLISLCAGEGRDVIPVLTDHPRRGDVTARLVEMDPELAGRARRAAAEAGLDRLSVVEGDAADLSLVAALVPAEVVLACGIFGNIVDADIRHTARSLPMLCAPGGWALWTRHRQEPDLTPQIRSWFTEVGFKEVAFDGPDDLPFGVGTARWPHATPPLNADVRLFTFVT